MERDSKKKGEQSSAWKADQRTKQSFVPKIIGLDYGRGAPLENKMPEKERMTGDAVQDQVGSCVYVWVCVCVRVM